MRNLILFTSVGAQGAKIKKEKKNTQLPLISLRTAHGSHVNRNIKKQSDSKGSTELTCADERDMIHNNCLNHSVSSIVPYIQA